MVEIDGLSYTVDALEMPSKHLSSNPMLEQALNITEAAILLYDVRDAASLKLAQGILDFIKESVSPREYGLLLVGNKSDADDDERQVPWAEGNKTAAALAIKCVFAEASARSGDNVAALFPTLGREILRIKKANQQRRDEAEKAALLKKNQNASNMPAKRRLGLWKTLTTPFFRR